MVEFAKSRGFLGYGVLPGGRNDKDSSHAVLPLAEYDELLRRIAWQSVISMRRSSRQRGR
jgi:hypothetical protein